MAPEVLNEKGHGKPVDLWSIGYYPSLALQVMWCDEVLIVRSRAITYMLLCGYTPFRSEDMKEVVRQTTEARVNFHDRYWKNVSDEGMLRAITSVHVRLFL